MSSAPVDELTSLIRCGWRLIALESFEEDRALKLPEYDPDDIENKGIARGLCPINDRIVAAGSSPATISLHDLLESKTLLSVNLSMDIRNEIHGLDQRQHAGGFSLEPGKISSGQIASATESTQQWLGQGNPYENLMFRSERREQRIPAEIVFANGVAHSQIDRRAIREVHISVDHVSVHKREHDARAPVPFCVLHVCKARPGKARVPMTLRLCVEVKQRRIPSPQHVERRDEAVVVHPIPNPRRVRQHTQRAIF